MVGFRVQFSRTRNGIEIIRLPCSSEENLQQYENGTINAKAKKKSLLTLS